MKTRKPAKPYWEMNTQELAEATKEFDREMVVDSFREPTPKERAKWERSQRKRGRPRQGLGHKVVAVSIEKGLLKRTDALAKRLGVSRAQLIARGLLMQLR